MLQRVFCISFFTPIHFRPPTNLGKVLGTVFSCVCLSFCLAIGGIPMWPLPMMLLGSHRLRGIPTAPAPCPPSPRRKPLPHPLALVPPQNAGHPSALAPAAPVIFKLVKLNLTIQGHPARPFPPTSTLDTFRLVYYVTQTAGKRTVSIRLKCLLVVLIWLQHVSQWRSLFCCSLFTIADATTWAFLVILVTWFFIL